MVTRRRPADSLARDAHSTGHLLSVGTAPHLDACQVFDPARGDPNQSALSP